MTKPLMAITGASGGIGQSLLARAIGRYRVRALFRSPSDLSKQCAERGCELVIGNLDEIRALDELVQEAEIVVHCAAKVIGFSRRDFVRVNIEGTRNLVERAVAAKVRRFVHLSSIAVYFGAEPCDAPFTEDLPLQEEAVSDSYAWSKLRAERIVADTFRNTATEFVILRPTFVYGPRIQSWTLLPLGLMEKNRSLFLGLDAGDGLLDPVHVEDVVEGILAAAETPGISGEIFNLGCEPATFREFYTALGGMIGKTPRLGCERTLRRIARIAGHGRKLSNKLFSPIASGIGTVLRMSLNQQTYPSSKAREVLGYAPEFSLGMGMLETELGLRETKRFAKTERVMQSADRHYDFRPAAMICPRTEGEITQAVRAAARRGLKVKAIGSLHSFVPIPATDGVCISLAGYNRLTAVEGTSVTVQAGMTIADLNAALARRGLALPIHGSHTGQTIAGAISTATHGGSMFHGTMADCVEKIRLIKASGEVSEIDCRDPAFGGAVVSLGLLGVVSAVTLGVVRQFCLRSGVLVKPIRDVIAEFERLHRANEYVDLRYYPRLDCVELLLMNRVDPPADMAAPNDSRQPSMAQKKIATWILKVLLRSLARSKSPAFHQFILRKMIGKSYQPRCGRSDDVLNFTELTGGEPFPIDDLEFAVPFERAKLVLQKLTEHFHRTKRYPCFFPVHLRCSKAGQAWLSPNYLQDVCWFEFWQYPADAEFYAMLHEFFAPYEYRPHWGKVCPAPRSYVEARFPKWKEFLALRNDWDSQGMFSNAYSSKWLPC